MNFCVIGLGEKVKELVDIPFDNNHYHKLFSLNYGRDGVVVGIFSLYVDF